MDHVQFTLINELLVFVLTPIANEISLSGSGIDSLQYCSRVDPVRLTLINELLVSVLTPIAEKIAPSGSGIDSSWDCSPVNCVRLTLKANELMPPGSGMDS